MLIRLTIPDASEMRVGKEAYVTLTSGTELHRVHPTPYGAAQFNDTALGNARFSPMRDAGGAIVPTLYGGEDFDCAVSEIILRCADVPDIDPATSLQPLQIVYPSDFAQHSHSVLRTTADLKLVDLTIVGQRKIGVDHNALLAGPSSTYAVTRAWAEQIHAKCPDAQGIYYSSYQCGPRFAVVLFGDRIADGGVEEVSTRRVADPTCHGEIAALADALSIDYQDI
jgi:hypothetical protein